LYLAVASSTCPSAEIISAFAKSISDALAEA